VALLLFSVLTVASLTIQNFSSQYLIEHAFWTHVLDEVSADHARRLRAEGPASLPREGKFRSWYVEQGGESAGVPASLAILEPGHYSTEGSFGIFRPLPGGEGSGSHHVVVVGTPSGRLITAVDIGDLENDQNFFTLMSLAWFLASLLIIVSVIFWLQTNLVHPIQDLAARLQSIDPSKEGERCPTSYRQKELLIIAQASNNHLERVEQFIKRERSLLDQASHEFRTPIAVIAGAVELLKQNALPEPSLPALGRIENAVADLSETMEALLYLAREPDRSGEAEDVSVLHTLLPRLVRDHEHLLAGKAVEMRLGHVDDAYLIAPEAMLRIALSNLIRNASESTDVGLIEVSLAQGVFSVVDSGAGFDPVEATRRFRENMRSTAPSRGQGLGLFLITRICERFGWKLTIESTGSGGTCARLDLSSSVIPL